VRPLALESMPMLNYCSNVGCAMYGVAAQAWGDAHVMRCNLLMGYGYRIRDGMVSSHTHVMRCGVLMGYGYVWWCLTCVCVIKYGHVMMAHMVGKLCGCHPCNVSACQVCVYFCQFF
jgi:hypothetical protein